MKKERKIKGITLVALVVTIVVLIILATISINIIFGEEGIIEKARQAKDMQSNAQVEEKQILADAANSMEQHVTGEREQITVDKEEYEQLLKDVSDLKSSTNNSMAWTKLASTSSTTAVTQSVENLNNYKYVVIAGNINSTKNIYTSALIPIETFKNETTGYWCVSIATEAILIKYVSDESIQMYTTNSNYIANLYGVK